MVAVLRWIILILVLFGNIVFWIHLFNRVNSTGLPRRKIKFIEKLVILGCFLVPTLILWCDRDWLSRWLVGPADLSAMGTEIRTARAMTIGLGCGAMAALLWLAPSWLIARFRLKIPPKALLTTTVERSDLRCNLGEAIYSRRWLRTLGYLPGNQLHLIETTHHQVHVERLLEAHDGLRIGHISDVHLTGYMHFDFYREAFDRLISTNPDVVILSGDLIDYESCLNQVQPLLDPVEAKLGCYFVLGNHDRRLKDVGRLRAMLVELGWHDLGSHGKIVEHAGEEIFLIGCERPWFDNPFRDQHERETVQERIRAPLRIGVSHSPDQVPWARNLELDLLFCGHTHGGQVRFPWIGPIVAPSRFGSRFASGWFDCSPTLMHVSRGISGTYPLRIACTPEVSSIVLRSNSS